MLKNKKILFIFILAVALFLIPTICYAKVEYTRNFPSNDGTIEVNLTGLALDAQGAKAYEYALVTKGGNPTKWFSLTEYTATTAKITLSPATSEIVNVLKQTDNGQLFIREKDQEEYVLDRLEVNLKLPFLNAVNVSKDSQKYTIKSLYGYKCNSGIMSFKWEKITDSKVISKYLEYKNDGKELNYTDLKQNVPTSGYSNNWGNESITGSYLNLYYNNSPKDGLYYLWIRSTDNNCKTIDGYYLHDGLPDAKTVAEYTGVAAGAPTISQVNAKAGAETIEKQEYHPTVGKAININIKFNQDIVLKEKPTLTIKFGNGENIKLTSVTASSNTLTYTYTIKSGDVGTLQVVSLTGGSVTNNEGTAAIYTLPAYSGYKVVAVESEQTNSQNQGQTGGNTTQTPNAGSQGENGSTQKPSSSGTSNGGKDTTTKNDSKLPQTGVVMLSVLLIFVVAIAIISKRKVNQYKDI